MALAKHIVYIHFLNLNFKQLLSFETAFCFKNIRLKLTTLPS